jgi:hypothetical protein
MAFPGYLGVYEDTTRQAEMKAGRLQEEIYQSREVLTVDSRRQARRRETRGHAQNYEVAARRWSSKSFPWPLVRHIKIGERDGES